MVVCTTCVRNKTKPSAPQEELLVEEEFTGLYDIDQSKPDNLDEKDLSEIVRNCYHPYF